MIAPGLSNKVLTQVEPAFFDLMVLREGCRNKVYPDTCGNPTVGIGHCVVPADGLKIGDVISQDRVEALFKVDGRKAVAAALDQAAEAGITSTEFLPFLASVNFQLGTAWGKKFPRTWRMILDGQYNEAADSLDGTLWQQQTPVRVQDFQKALRALPPNTRSP